MARRRSPTERDRGDACVSACLRLAQEVYSISNAVSDLLGDFDADDPKVPDGVEALITAQAGICATLTAKAEEEEARGSPCARICRCLACDAEAKVQTIRLHLDTIDAFAEYARGRPERWHPYAWLSFSAG